MSSPFIIADIGRPPARRRQRALLADAPLVYDFSSRADQAGADDRGRFQHRQRQLPRGLAADRPLNGLILVTPFNSLKAAAQGLYPWLPIGPFFQHEIDAASVLQKSKVPVALIAAERDDLILPERTAALRSRVGNLVFDQTIPRAGHNDIYVRSDFQDAMRRALAAVSK